MPLKQQTYDLRDERDRLDDELDALSERAAECQLDLEAAAADGADGGGDDLNAETVRLQQDLEEIQREAADVQTHLAGLAWAIDEWGNDTDAGPDVATDGGKRELSGRARTSETSDEDPREDDPKVQQARRRLEADDAEAVTELDGDDAAHDPRDPPAGGGETSDNATESAPDPASTRTDGAVTVTLGGLTAGEYARVADLVSAASQQRVGFAQGGGPARQGQSRNVFVAAGTVSAPWIESGMDLEAQADAVGDLSPNFVEWLETQINDLTTPPESVGNDFGDRVAQAMDQKRAADSNDNSTEPTT